MCNIYVCVYVCTYVCIWLCRHVCVNFLISLWICVLCTSYKKKSSFIKQCYLLQHYKLSAKKCSPTSAPHECIVWPECGTRLQDFRFVYHLSQEQRLPVVIHYGDRTHMRATVKYNGNSRNIHPLFFSFVISKQHAALLILLRHDAQKAYDVQKALFSIHPMRYHQINSKKSEASEFIQKSETKVVWH
jgi:hypothetical protein